MLRLLRRRRVQETPREFIPMAEAVAGRGLAEAELRSLLVAGKLRGYRDGAGLKFLRSDLDAVRPLRAQA